MQFFAFEAGVKDKAPQLGALMRADPIAYEPQTIVIADLQPGTAYAIRLLGVRRADRERCVAHVTTPHRSEPMTPETEKRDKVTLLKWTIRALNHDCVSSRVLTEFEQEVYSIAAHAGYERSSSPMLILHSSCLRIPIEKLSAMALLLGANRVRIQVLDR